jgi:hypothetical protein
MELLDWDEEDIALVVGTGYHDAVVSRDIVVHRMAFPEQELHNRERGMD